MVPNTKNKIPMIPAVKNPVAANALARSSSRLPKAREMLLPLPIPKVKPTACIMAMAEKITPTAPDALVPIWLTKKVSAIL